MNTTQHNNEHRPRLLTVKAAMQDASISRSTLHELIRCGRIRAVKIGSRGVRIPGEELDRFIEEQLEAGYGD